MAKKDVHKKTSLWKIISIVFIVLFAAILIGGLLKAYHFRSSFKPATAAQIDSAKTIAISSLASQGENVSSYVFRASDNIRPIGAGSEYTPSTIEVSLYNESVRNLYIIDVDSGSILMYDRMEFYDGANHSMDRPQEMGRKDIGVLFGFGGPRGPNTN
jgi:zona occludens toxin (predicted ATPase)